MSNTSSTEVVAYIEMQMCRYRNADVIYYRDYLDF